MFNPLGNRKFTSSCDTAKQALASTGASYQIVDAVPGTTARIRIGNDIVNAYDAGGILPRHRRGELATPLPPRHPGLLNGFPQQQKPCSPAYA